MTRKPPPLGSINGFCRSTAWMGRKSFTFDGTTRGLVRAAKEAGAKAGSIIRPNFGGNSRAGTARKMIIVEAAHDDRAYGLWASDI